MEDYNSKQVDRCLGQGIGGVGQGGRGGGLLSDTAPAACGIGQAVDLLHRYTVAPTCSANIMRS